ncbi:AcsA protein [Halomonas litopenaei]|uniref:AcsA protein n=1 Tax=Halomonas litopenaei TaxID=2109328 RepID=A0ABX5J0K8_9GAMM|nr:MULTISPECIES: IucA/IucC family protein [Halomonas]PTL89130.1 AcsA protein [Halomonas sp. SYSU XM8]PTL94942.1 AcsA protein [Halomonas litopenaei]
MAAFDSVSSPVPSPQARRLASEQILQSLVDGLLVEGILEIDSLAGDDSDARSFAAELFGDEVLVVHPAARLWRQERDQGASQKISLVMLLEPGIAQDWQKVPGTPVLALHGGTPAPLDPVALMRRVFGGDDQTLTPGQRVFLDALEDSLWQATASMAHGVDTRHLASLGTLEHFTILEQWASLLDRPYHPTAKAKQGLSAAEYRAYMAEFANPVELYWVAVARDRLTHGAGVGALAAGVGSGADRAASGADRATAGAESGAFRATSGADRESAPLEQPADWLLAAEERQALSDEMRAKGIADSHLALPVHPWQHDHALPKWLAEDFAAGHCITLEASAGRWWPTSSLRSLLPAAPSSDGAAHSLKLPMAIHSLGASRYLPAVKMINGDLSARLLEEARQRDPLLESALHLCDEGKWWAYLPGDASLFDEAPRHLSAMVRSYPQALLEQAGTQLVPMATLGTPLPMVGASGPARISAHHVFDDWMVQRGMEASAASAQALFGELCARFFEINLRMLRLGMLAEVHGQNAVLVVRQGRVEGLLLRDHDSLRINVGQLERHGMQDPCYRIKPGHANTLYHDSQEALLFWLQTLAIQVNLRAIIDTLAGHYGLCQRALWRDLAVQLKAQLDAVPFDAAERNALKSALFERERWPYKRLIAPIIERAGGPGSMPFGVSETVNPLRACQGALTPQNAEATAGVEQGVGSAGEADRLGTLQQA